MPVAHSPGNFSSILHFSVGGTMLLKPIRRTQGCLSFQGPRSLSHLWSLLFTHNKSVMLKITPRNLLRLFCLFYCPLPPDIYAHKHTKHTYFIPKTIFSFKSYRLKKNLPHRLPARELLRIKEESILEHFSTSSELEN